MDGWIEVEVEAEDPKPMPNAESLLLPTHFHINTFIVLYHNIIISFHKKGIIIVSQVRSSLLLKTTLMAMGMIWYDGRNGGGGEGVQSQS